MEPTDAGAPDDLDVDTSNRLAAWWLGLAPTRQEEALSARPPLPPWLVASLAEAGFPSAGDALPPLVAEFLDDQRNERDAISRDAGRTPPPPP